MENIDTDVRVKRVEGTHVQTSENFFYVYSLYFTSFTVMVSQKVARVGRLFRKAPYFVDSNLDKIRPILTVLC